MLVINYNYKFCSNRSFYCLAKNYRFNHSVGSMSDLRESQLGTELNVFQTRNRSNTTLDNSRSVNAPSIKASSKPEIEYPDGGFRAYTIIAGSFLGLTANFGLLNSVGAIQTYLATHQLAHTSATTISWIFSIYLAFSFAITIFVGPYFDAKGTLKPMIAGNILSFIGIFSMGNCSTVWQFILALSLCVSLGNALCISPLIGVISHWFYRRLGFALGLSSIGGSVGGMVIPLLLRSLYAKVGFTWAIRILSFFYLALNTIATILIKERFTGATTVEEDADNNNTKQKLINKSRQYFDYSALKDSKFGLLVIGVLFGESALLSVVTYIGTYAVTFGFTESESYILLTVFNAAGIFGRLLPGYLSDKIGHFNVMIMMLFGSTISILVLWLPFGDNRVCLYIFTTIFGFTSSLILSLTPVCLRQISPVRKFGSRYGLMYFFVSCGNLVGIPIASAIIGDSSRFHYNMFALFCGLITLLSTCFWVFSRYKSVGFRFNVKI